jgi:hypothetical protein
VISALELENFKGVAGRQRIEFAPLTLLFGANSAGKSTILQALLYLHEILERGTADVDRTELGGSVLELGGFARLVHRHDTNRSIKLRIEFTTPLPLERFGRDLAEFPFPDLDDDVECAWLELTLSMRISGTARVPVVERANFGVVGEEDPLVWLELGPSFREGDPILARVNLAHRILPTDGELASAWDEVAVATESTFGDAPDAAFDGPRPVFAVSRPRLSALPPVDKPLRVIVGDEVEDLRAQATALLQKIPPSELEKDKIGHQVASMREELEGLERTERQVRLFLEMIVLGTTAQLLTALQDAPYIGPLRSIPPRGFLYERAGRLTSWADGLAAWDLLLADRGDLVERTNEWLKRLGAGCEVVVQQLYDERADAEELSYGHVDKTVRRLLLDTGSKSLVLPSEVGAGVSQIIPVVVAALAGEGELCLVEQPEIHVHPAVQVRLGDLFIDAAVGKRRGRVFLVETHSEHLILRLLRRIRETAADGLPENAVALLPKDLSVVYIENGRDGVVIRSLRVDETGDFVDEWPNGFFDERRSELF